MEIFDFTKKNKKVTTNKVAMAEYKESVFKRFLNKIRGIFKGN